MKERPLRYVVIAALLQIALIVLIDWAIAGLVGELWVNRVSGLGASPAAFGGLVVGLLRPKLVWRCIIGLAVGGGGALSAFMKSATKAYEVPPQPEYSVLMACVYLAAFALAFLLGGHLSGAMAAADESHEE